MTIHTRTLCVLAMLLAGCAELPNVPMYSELPDAAPAPTTQTAAVETANPAEPEMVSRPAPPKEDNLVPASPAVTVAPAPATSGAPAAAIVYYTPAVATGVILYEKARNKSAVLGLLEPNANVTATGEEENGYMRVESRNISGWVDKQLMKRSGEQPLFTEAPAPSVARTPRPKLALVKPLPSRLSNPATDGSSTGRVVLYSASWCPYCDKARAYFHRTGVAFDEYDMEASSKGRLDYEAMNGDGIPIVLVNNHKIVGWKQAEFERHLGRSQPAEPVIEARVERAVPAKIVALAKPVQSINTDAGPAYTPKVSSGVIVYSQPTNRSPVGGLIKGSEQVIAMGEEQNGYMRVQSASGEGWVDKSLMRKL